jgi:hypothetical protein
MAAATVPAPGAGQALMGAPAVITMAGLVTPVAMAEDFTPDMSPRLTAPHIVQASIAVGKPLALPNSPANLSPLIEEMKRAS